LWQYWQFVAGKPASFACFWVGSVASELLLRRTQPHQKRRATIATGRVFEVRILALPTLDRER
jgi:hypothetical protein